VLFIRGDLEVNETKLTNYLGYGVHPANITENSGLHAGYIGPYHFNQYKIKLFDRSLEDSNNLVCGGNADEYHYTGLSMERDLGKVEYHDFAKAAEGGICPVCGNAAVSVSRGIEVGNIFQLGAKYTESMNMTCLDGEGKTQHPVMGCYGIGVGRLAASVCEAHHDEHGPIWPMSIAPWQIHLCAVRSDIAEVRISADTLYDELQLNGIEVIYDDRNVSAGIMFNDADLLGVPLRIVVSPRNLKNHCIEIISRDKKESMQISVENSIESIKKMIHERLIGV